MFIFHRLISDLCHRCFKKTYILVRNVVHRFSVSISLAELLCVFVSVKSRHTERILLKSLCFLQVTDNSVLKSSLREAISDYIRKSAKPLRCPASCKIGSQSRTCACQCRGHRMVTSDCCPAEPGVARLNVTVVRAEGLWGDYFSKTDGYVKVFYGNEGATTPVIWNNNFPSWNYLVRFGTVNLNQRK